MHRWIPALHIFRRSLCRLLPQAPALWSGKTAPTLCCPQYSGMRRGSLPRRLPVYLGKPGSPIQQSLKIAQLGVVVQKAGYGIIPLCTVDLPGAAVADAQNADIAALCQIQNIGQTAPRPGHFPGYHFDGGGTAAVVGNGIAFRPSFSSISEPVSWLMLPRPALPHFMEGSPRMASNSCCAVW